MRRREDNKKKQLILGIFIAVIMVGSMFGVIFYGYNRDEGKVTYNKISFSRVGSGWLTKINKKDIFFNYLPTEVEDINLDSDIINRIKNTLEFDITYDINNSYAEEIAFSQYLLGEALDNLNLYVRNGFTTDNKFDVPVITCEEASDYVPVAYFKESNETKVNIENNCIIINIKNGIDAIRVKDRLLYGIFSVIK